MSRSTAAAVAAALALITGAGACDLIGLADVTFRFRSRPYEVGDSAFADLPLASDGALPVIPCAEEVGCTIPCAGCGLACRDGVCQASFSVVLRQEVNLAQDATGLEAAGPVLDHVELRRVWIDYANAFRFETPAIDLYVGPASATAPESSGVVLLGTVPPLRAESQGTADVQLAAEGRALFARLARSYRQPFTIIGRARVVVPGGASARGRLTFSVSAEAVAGL